MTLEATAERRRPHKATRAGIHWRANFDGDGLRLEVPDTSHPAWKTVRRLRITRPPAYIGEFPTEHRDVVVAALRDVFGRDGLTPVSHVDIDLRLDAADPQTGTTLDWAGMSLATTAPDSAGVRLLGGTTVVTGALLVKGRGTAKRIEWEPGTVVRVLDIPRPCLAGQPGHAYTVVADTDDDPADALRREGHRLLGLRHRLDIPPAPTDAFKGRLAARDRTAGMRVAPADYPHTDADDELVVDPDNGVVYVTRFGYGVGRGRVVSDYVLPLTAERVSVLGAYEEEFGRSRAAYATAGANAEAAALLRAGGWTAQRLCEVRDELFAVVDADDARALLGRAPAEWTTAGWPMEDGDRVPAAGDPRWRATDAARFADAGIDARRAYEPELRRDRGRWLTATEAIARDLIVPNHAGRRAAALLDGVRDCEDLREKLVHARSVKSVEREGWTQEPSNERGIQLDEHRFVLADGSHVLLWTVRHWFEDPKVSEHRTTYLSEESARHAWTEDRDMASDSDDDDCPGPDVDHCDNCGATAPDDEDEFLRFDWMVANFGLACGTHCYEEMSNDSGEHARRHHQS
ncbi:hypothetical protein [Embleya sp. MST-111070]|uniref:hypothetical protein n=1 Tax=Embleya sp. MST-111070 TaxID=3398231 RepID=UPI003F73D38F